MSICIYCKDPACNGKCWRWAIGKLKEVCCCCASPPFPEKFSIFNEINQEQLSPMRKTDRTTASYREKTEPDFHNLGWEWANGPDNSDDETHDVIAKANENPYIGQPVVGNYNCFSWAVSPVTGILGVFNPPGIDNRVQFTVDQLQRATITFLRKRGCKGITASNNLKSLMNSCACSRACGYNTLIIAMRVSDTKYDKDNNQYNDYHFVKYWNGIWSHKPGPNGKLFKVNCPNDGTLPDTVWRGHAIYSHADPDGTRASFERVSKYGQVNVNPLYKKPTKYVKVNVPC